ncbi:MAG: hypothetical protein M3070_00180 [Actinomycetota bacterium]|nr:hypothetical protein [Actinomycetota bacterium]
MISGVAFCPHPPLLVPEVAAGAAAELDDLRGACRAAIARIAAPVHRLVLLGAGPVSRAHAPSARGAFAGYGVTLDVTLGESRSSAPTALPLSLTVGAWLVRDTFGPDAGAIAFEVGPDFGPTDKALSALAIGRASCALLVMGDGSARRSTAAPGYLDERAEAFDAGVADALRSGVGYRLNQPLLDSDAIAPELLCASVPVWQEVAGLTEAARWRAELLYEGAPYGVGYFVAAWTAR